MEKEDKQRKGNTEKRSFKKGGRGLGECDRKKSEKAHVIGEAFLKSGCLQY